MEILEKKLNKLNEYRNGIHTKIKSKCEQKLMVEYIDYVNAVAKPNITKDELQTLIDKWYSGNMKAKERLLEVSQPYIVMTVIKNFSNQSIPLHELIHEANKTINNITSTNINLDNFYNHIASIIINRCKRILENNKSHTVDNKINDHLSINQYTIENDVINNINYEEMVNKLVKNRYKNIVNLRYVMEYTMQEIADMKDCKKQRIDDILKIIHRELKNEYMKNKLKDDLDMYFSNISIDDRELISMLLNHNSIKEIAKKFNLKPKATYKYVLTFLHTIRNNINFYAENGYIDKNTFNMLFSDEEKIKEGYNKNYKSKTLTK